MFCKSVILFLILIILYYNDLLVIASIHIQILGLFLLYGLYYAHIKFILFCKDKLKKIEINKRKNKYSVWKWKYLHSTSPFLDACKRGDTILIRKLINSGVNIYETNENGDGAIHYAIYGLINSCDKKDASCLWTLHNVGCPINLKNTDGYTPLHLAAAYGHVSLIKWLARKGADVLVEPLPFRIAMSRGHKQAAALLVAIEYGIPPCKYIYDKTYD